MSQQPFTDREATMRALRLRVERLECRTVPAQFVWTGNGANTKWSTLANWTQDGGLAQAQPGENDGVKIASNMRSVADVAKVGSISVINNGQWADIELVNDLTVIDSVNVKSLNLRTDFNLNAQKTLTVRSGGVFTVSDGLSLISANLTLGSPTGHDVSASIHLPDLPAAPAKGTIASATITNYGTLTFTGRHIGTSPDTGASAIVNGVGGTLEIKNGDLGYTGTLTNAGTLKFNAVNVSVTPEFTNLGTVIVYPGTVEFRTKAVQTGGEFQLRNATVKVSGETQTFAIADGSLTGKGSIDANLTMGTASEFGTITFPSLNPGLVDPTNPTAMVTGTIAITKDFTILSNGASVNFEVIDGTSLDKVTVGGQAVIHGNANIKASANYKPAAATQLTLISAVGGLTGTFGTVNIIRDPFAWDHALNPGRRHYWAGLHGTETFFIQVQVEQQQPPPSPPSPPPYPPLPPAPNE